MLLSAGFVVTFGALAGFFQNCNDINAPKQSSQGSRLVGTQNSTSADNSGITQSLSINGLAGSLHSGNRTEIAGAADLDYAWDCVGCTSADTPTFSFGGDCTAGASSGAVDWIGSSPNGTHRVQGTAARSGCWLAVTRTARSGNRSNTSTFHFYFEPGSGTSSMPRQSLTINGLLGGDSESSRRRIPDSQPLNYAWSCTHCTSADTPTFSFGGSCSAGASSGAVDWIGTQLSGTHTIAASATRSGCWLSVTRTVRGAAGSNTSTFHFQFDGTTGGTPPPQQSLSINNVPGGTSASARAEVRGDLELNYVWTCSNCTSADVPTYTLSGSACASAASSAPVDWMTGISGNHTVTASASRVGCAIDITRTVHGPGGDNTTTFSFDWTGPATSTAPIQFLSMNGQEGSRDPARATQVQGDLPLNYVWNCTHCTSADTPTFTYGGDCGTSGTGPIDWIGSSLSGNYLVPAAASRRGCWISITRTVRGAGGNNSATFYFNWTGSPVVATTATTTSDPSISSTSMPTQLITMNGQAGSTDPNHRTAVQGDLNLNYSWTCSNCTAAEMPTFTVSGNCGLSASGPVDWIGSSLNGSYVVPAAVERLGCNLDITRTVRGPGGTRTATFYFSWTGPCTTRISDTQYLAMYPDIRNAGLNPWLHYRRAGQAEGRCPLNGACSESMPAITNEEYVELYPDLPAGGVSTPWDARQHFEQHGRGEGRCRLQNVYFRPTDYMAANPDIAQWAESSARSELQGRGNPPEVIESLLPGVREWWAKRHFCDNVVNGSEARVLKPGGSPYRFEPMAWLYGAVYQGRLANNNALISEFRDTMCRDQTAWMDWTIR